MVGVCRLWVRFASLGAVACVAIACGSTRREGFVEESSPTSPGGGGAALADAGGDSSFGACATSSHEAALVPAALLVALDKSGTMAQANKYRFAQQAIVQAIDQGAFDSLSLGILGFPSSRVQAPACLFGLIDQVDCGVSALPHVPLALAGPKKSNEPGGVRNEIYKWLANASPNPGDGDGNPTYAALESAISALQAWPARGKRVALYITDGGASCASVTNRAGYTDGNGCNDWEHPSAIVDLLTRAHGDAQAPVNTFVVGVPGADSHGESVNVPPYSVRLALSAYAWAGSPETADPACTGKTFTKTNTDPQTACHFDMTRGNYSVQALVDAIAQIRGRLLGCEYELPPAPEGETLDRGRVNVELSGVGAAGPLFKRGKPGDTCDDCWDYTGDGKIVLLGKACEDVKSSPTAKVQIVVGCSTRVR